MKKLSLLIVTLILALCVALPALAEADFTFDRTVRTVFEGQTLQLQLIRQNGALEEGTITYSSSAPKIGSVDENGLVTGHKKGEVTITATLKVGKRTYKGSITLTVQRAVTEVTVLEDEMVVFAPGDPVIETVMEPKEDSAEADFRVAVLQMGRDQSFRASLLPKDASDRHFTVTSSDPEVARAVGTTTLRPVAPGECVATIASTTNPEVFVQYRVLVTQPVKSVTLTAEKKRTGVGGTIEVIPEIKPADATITALEWSSDNTKVATVDENGIVTGVGKGTATIKARAADGTKRYGTIQITIAQQPTEIELNAYQISVPVGSYKNMSATVLPKNANNKEVVWSSSDESVAKINSYGRVTPVSRGTCVITCTSKEAPEVFVTANVEVTQPVTRVAFNEKEVTVNVGSSVRVYWSTTPADASDPSVTLKSNSEKIATVSQDGVIYGVKRGSATITATANDGSGKRGSITVNVLQPVEGVHMKNDTVNIDLEEPTTLTAVLEPADASNNRMTWTTTDRRIVTVSGNRNRPTVTGHAWGTATIIGTTEDGGYSTTATINVGNYDKALEITDLYLQDNRIKINVQNVSNMNITRFYYTVTAYDIYGQPLPCNTVGTNVFEGSYSWNTLYEGDSTTHGKFTFNGFVQPLATIGRVDMVITSYCTDNGYNRNIRPEKQRVVSYISPLMVTPEPVPELTPVPAPIGDAI